MQRPLPFTATLARGPALEAGKGGAEGGGGDDSDDFDEEGDSVQLIARP